MKKIYLSGKISGLSVQEYSHNFADAERQVRLRYQDEELEIVNPTALPAVHTSWADYMLRDLMLLKDCNVIALLPNWKDSAGARIEYEFAQMCGIEVVYLNV